MKIKLLLLLTLFAYGVKAQWTDDTDANTLVADASTLDLLVANNSQGETYVVYWKSVGEPDNLELRLQILDVEGNRLLGDEGVLVSDEIPMLTYVTQSSIAVDGDDNLYIGVTASDGNDGYLFKLDSDGNNLWGSSGVIPGNGFAIKLCPLDNGELLMAWLGEGTNIQRFDADGNPIWETPISVETGGNNAPADIFSLSDGDFIVVFHTYSFGVNSNLNAQRFDSDGAPVWDDYIQLSNQSTQWNTRYSHAQDGDTIYYGYSAASGLRFDSYLQRIDPDGTLPYGINGRDFDVAQEEYEISTSIAHSDGSDFIWSICRYTDSSQGMVGESVQKFNKVTGERILGENAHELYPVSNDHKKHDGPLRLVNDAPFFVLETGMDNGATPTNLNVIQLDGNGNFAWEDEYEPVATYEANNSRTQLTERINGQSLVVFYEDKGDGERIYAQNYTESGMAAGEILLNHDQFRFQNPVTNRLDLVSNGLIENVVIYNIVGKVVYNAKRLNSGRVEIDVNNWPAGLYLMSVRTDEGLAKGMKFIVQ